MNESLYGKIINILFLIYNSVNLDNNVVKDDDYFIWIGILLGGFFICFFGFLLMCYMKGECFCNVIY